MVEQQAQMAQTDPQPMPAQAGHDKEKGQEQHQQHHPAPAHHAAGRHSNKIMGIDERYFVLLLAAIITIILIWLRTGLMGSDGLFEPDGFFYYTAIKQVIASGFHDTGIVSLSGYPWHNGINEAPGLIWFVLIPYSFLQFFGVSALTVMREIAIAFGFFIAVAVYYFTKPMSNNSKYLGLLAMMFVAASSGNIARTAGTVFRGDTFISFFLVLSLIFMVLFLGENKDQRRKLIYLAISVFIMSTGDIYWNGGYPLIMTVFTVATVLLAVVGFISGRKELMKDTMFLTAGIFVSYLLDLTFVAMGLANPPLITVTQFAIIIVPLALMVSIGYWLLTSTIGFVKTPLNRLAFLVAAILVVAAAAYIIIGPQFALILSGNNSLYNTNSNIAQTTQELQKPTYEFLYASFGLELFLAPIGAVLCAIVFWAPAKYKRTLLLALISFVVALIVIGLISLVVALPSIGIWVGGAAIWMILFLLGVTRYKQLFASSDGIKELHVSNIASYAFIVALGYLLVTSYMQANAIRYNATVSVPIAVFSAVAFYMFYKILEPWKIKDIALKYTAIAVIVILLGYQVYLTQQQSFTSIQADGINPAFLQAMSWLSNNTAPNSKVLALWPDGSVVEGWGNRTSFMDSVGGENGTRIIQFSKFLFSNSTNSSYLVNDAHSPDYIIVRNFFIVELAGIAQEGNITSNLTNYGFAQLNSFTISGNYTQQIYSFTNGYYDAQMIVQPVNNSSKRITAYLGQAAPGSRSVQIQHILLVNSTTNDYNIVTAPSNGTANYTLMIQFAGRNITQAAIIGPSLPETNLFKLLFACGQDECSFGNGNVSAQLVYSNVDTKIIKLTYQ